MTTRLYYDDPFRLTFDATVQSHGEHAGKRGVVLDESAFFPEGGGQLADHGALAQRSAAPVAVVDVQEIDDGRVLHVVSGDLPAVGTRTTGTIDKARRKTHMALHTGQHMLSAALLDVAKADTVSARLGESECTIDLSIEKISDGDLFRAEDLVNSVIDDDVVVRSFFPAPGELDALPLRRKPKVSENVRVVVVDGFDCSPCGGTHVTRTGQIGLLRVEKLERKKGQSRVYFTSGPRARRRLFDEDRHLGELARAFSCGHLDVQSAVDKLKNDLKDARGAFSRVQGQLAERTKAALLVDVKTRAPAIVVETFDDVDPGFLRAVASGLAEAAPAIVLAARTVDGTHVLVMRGTDASFDAGALLQKLAVAAGGKGGGKPDLAQGRLPAGVDVGKLLGPG